MNSPARFEGEGALNLQSEAHRSSPPLSLFEIWQIAKLRAGIILGAAAVVFALIALTDLSVTPLYRGSAVVIVDQQQNKALEDIEQVLSGQLSDQTLVMNQMQVLQSRGLAWRVISKLGLDRDNEFNPTLRKNWYAFLHRLNPLAWIPRASSADLQSAAARAQKRKDDIIDRFESRLSVSQLQQSQAIRIGILSESPVKAARIADTLAEAYVEDQLNAKFEATLNATHWLDGRLGELAEQARKADAAVEQYKTDHHITEVEAPGGTGVVSVLDQQIAAINAQLVQAHTDVAQANATLARVRALVSSGHAADVSQVVSSSLIGQLVQQQAHLIQEQGELSARYGPAHPKMLALKAQQRDLEGKIQEEIRRVVGTAENDVAVAQARQNSLQQSLSQLEAQSSLQGQAYVKLHELEANATSSRALYDSFVARSKQTQQQEGLQIPDARIISRSPIPTWPSYPATRLVLIVAGFAALLAGLALAFIVERLDRGFRTASRVESTLGVPVLSTLPHAGSAYGTPSMGGKAGNTVADLPVQKPLSSYAESIRALHLGITLSNVDKPPRVLLVTSALPGEGKTTTAISLARHIARAGQKVVIVDADLRRPNIQRSVGMLEIAKDLVDVLREDLDPEIALVKDPKSSAMILPAKRHVKNAPDIMQSQALSKLVQALRTRFDVVILDSAPVLPVTDSKVLARTADSILFVVRWEKTSRDAARDALKSLRETQVPVAGIALTRADARRFHYYSFGYSGHYYAYTKYYET